MDRAAIRDLHQPGALLLGEVSAHLDLPGDPVDAPRLRLALLAILRVDPVVGEENARPLEGPRGAPLMLS